MAKDSGHPETEWADEPLQYITSGMKVRLRHTVTDKNLHSHDFRPPVSDVDFQNEVSAYGMTNFIGDANDDWFVEIEHGDKSDKESSKRVRTLRTVFRLRHAMTGCYLFSHKVKLPDWGFEQQEVTCNKNAMKANSLWMVETATHPNRQYKCSLLIQLFLITRIVPPDAQKVNYRLPGLLSKFWELQKVMWITNAGLTDRHVYDSRPYQWPQLRRGIVRDNHNDKNCAPTEATCRTSG
jgi:dolichyl-phosphate-mannose-protein mannosyltransferase